MKNRLLLVVVLVAFWGHASSLVPFPASKGKLPVQNVPAEPSGRYVLSPAAALTNHILYVNATAVDAATWSAAATYAGGLFRFNVWTNSVSPLTVSDMVSFSSFAQPRFGEKAKLVVVLVDDPGGLPVVAAAGHWAVVNLNPLKAGAPSAQLLRNRTAKALLKGLVLAAGCGASSDSRCVSYGDAFDSITAFDATGITIAPTTYFPLCERIAAIGGGAMACREDLE